MSDQLICQYGCRRPASFITSNGKGCCEPRFTLCSAYRASASKRQQGTGNSFFGHRHTDQFKKHKSESQRGASNPFFGRVHSPEVLARISSSLKGRFSGSKSPTFGRKRTEEERKKISKARVLSGVARGAKNPNWRGGISKSRKADMSTTAYKAWRAGVYVRDDFTCQMCHKRGGDLQADHIKPWAYFPELRYLIENGRTLCLKCHRLTFKGNLKWRKKVG